MSERSERIVDTERERSERIVDTERERSERIVDTERERSERIVDTERERSERIVDTASERSERTIDTERERSERIVDTEDEGTAFGIDIGGSGMKAGIVDLDAGDLRGSRHRVATPKPATPDAMAEVVAQLVEHFAWPGSVGVAFPAVVRNGVAKSAANIDPSWIDIDVDAVFTAASGRPVSVINDADAAGLAEVRYGAGKDRPGVVLMLTLGTGIGSGLFLDGRLVPNTEFGHLEIDGHNAERRAAASARDRDRLSWREWAKRVNRYLERVIALISPDLIIVGGGVSRQSDKWMSYIDVDAEVVPAALTNEAGIVGAALVATLA